MILPAAIFQFTAGRMANQADSDKKPPKIKAAFAFILGGGVIIRCQPMIPII